VAGDVLNLDSGFDDATKWTIVNEGGTFSISGGLLRGDLVYGNCYQAVLQAYKWYRAKYDLKTVAQNGARVHFGTGTGAYNGPQSTIAANNIICAGRAQGASPQNGGIRGGGAASFVGTVDNFTIQPFILSQLIAYRNYGRQVSIASAFTLTTGIPGGIVSRLSVNGDGTYNFVHAWHDGTNMRLDTVVNSYTVVSKVNAAAAYGAGRVIKINFPSANVAQALYNNVQIGGAADVSGVPYATAAGLFLTGPGTLGDPVVT